MSRSTTTYAAALGYAGRGSPGFPLAPGSKMPLIESAHPQSDPLRGGQRVEPELEPGDVVVFDSGVLHGVSEVEAGERVVLVAHTHMEVR